LLVIVIDHTDSDFKLFEAAISLVRLQSKKLLIAPGNAETILDLLSATALTWLPTLIILNVHRCEASHVELLSRMKAEPALRPLPIVILADEAAAADVSALYNASASCLIVKPGEPSRRMECIRSVIEFWGCSVLLPIREEG
jgi:DNA-binding NarL/FixJ family response regulator